MEIHFSFHIRIRWDWQEVKWINSKDILLKTFLFWTDFCYLIEQALKLKVP